eukprot:scaffold15012_cov47-Cyclotella_meneghiniana.AAC.5
MQAQANRRRSNSLRTSKSRVSFIDSIAAIHLDSSREATPNRPRRNTSDGVIETELRVQAPLRKSKSVNLPGNFQIALKNNSDSELTDSCHKMPECILDGKRNRRFYVPSDEDDSPKVTAASHRPSLKVSFSPPPLSHAHPVRKSSNKKIHTADTLRGDANITSRPASPRVFKKYNPKEYKENPRSCSPISYSIGDVAQSSSHMMIETCQRAALINACQLKTHDFAFVKRSDGSWTYAILAGHCKDIDNEEVMVFVTSETGCTKVIKQRNWAKSIRGVATDKKCNEDVKGVPQIIIADRDANDDWNCSQLSDFLFLPPPINANQ